jgi:hypothetical protein
MSVWLAQHLLSPDLICTELTPHRGGKVNDDYALLFEIPIRICWEDSLTL